VKHKERVARHKHQGNEWQDHLLKVDSLLSQP
jgi:hypothetical protein